MVVWIHIFTEADCVFHVLLLEVSLVAIVVIVEASDQVLAHLLLALGSPGLWLILLKVAVTHYVFLIYLLEYSQNILLAGKGMGRQALEILGVEILLNEWFLSNVALVGMDVIFLASHYFCKRGSSLGNVALALGGQIAF